MKWGQATGLLGLALLALSACYAGQGMRRDGRVLPRVAYVSLDGGAAQVLDRLVGEGAMPTLAALRRGGAWAEGGLQAHFPSKTAAGHAALWTGAYGDVNGVTSNKMLRLPAAEFPITEVEEGFDARALAAEPIWTTAARQGKRAVVLYGTHLSPLSVYEPGGRWGGPFPKPGRQSLIDGYGEVTGKSRIVGQVLSGPFSPVAAPEALGWRPSRPVLGQSFRLGDRPFQLWLLADPLRGPGYNRAAVAPQDRPRAIQWLERASGESAWATGLKAEEGPGARQADLGLLKLSPEGQALLYLTPAMRTMGNDPTWERRLIDDVAPFHAGGGAEPYKAGKFGTPWAKGGDGEAEAHYLATVRHLLAGERRRVERLVASGGWDLAVHYVTYPDEALHLWYGLADPGTPYFKPSLAPRVWQALHEVGFEVDRLLAAYRSDPRVALVVAADHGFAGLGRRFYPNRALHEAGLLALTPSGQVDLARTQAYYPPTDGCFVVVNRQSRAQGIVAEAQVPQVLARVEAVMRAAKDPQGKPILRATLRATDHPELGIVGPRCGDVYLDPVPGTTFDAAASAAHLVADLPQAVGGHLFDPRRPDMLATLALAGPGVKPGTRLGRVLQSQVAPTVASLLGIQAPAQAQGLALGAALLPPPPPEAW